MIATLEHRLVATHFPFVWILDSKYPNNLAEGGVWCSQGESQDSSGGFPTADRLRLSGAVIPPIHRGFSLSAPHLISTLPQICGSWKKIWALFTWCNLGNANPEVSRIEEGRIKPLSNLWVSGTLLVGVLGLGYLSWNPGCTACQTVTLGSLLCLLFPHL